MKKNLGLIPPKKLPPLPCSGFMKGGQRQDAVYPMVNEKSTSAPGIHPMAQWAHRCLPLLRVQLGPKEIRRRLPFLRAEVEEEE